MTQKHDKKWFDSAAFRELYHTDEPLGSFVQGSVTRFALWAPTAQHVWLKLYEQGSGGGAFCCVPMQRGDRGVWTREEARNLDGVYYTYDVTVDGVIRETGDPYARACGVNGRRSMVIDLARTNPPGWESDRAPALREQNIIYELHVKDFTWDPSCGVSEANRGRYLGLCEENTTLFGDGKHETGLAWIRRLGATHVQLLPVYDYGSVDEGGAREQFNWGYDPVNYNVPEGSYASDAHDGAVRISELKQAVQSLHKNGLRVVMDVVYNHTYSLDVPLFQAVPWYYYRQQPGGRASNGSGCGNEVASERSMAGRYILDSVLYWAEEYHIDGFRFDLMGLMDVGLMNRIRKALDARFGRGQKLVYGEPWAGGRAHPRPGTRLAHKGNLGRLHKGVGAFCDATRDAIKGSVFEETGRGFATGGGFSAQWLANCMRAWVGCGDAFPVKAPGQTISYLSCHDDLTLWDKLVCTLDPKREFDRLDAQVLRANRMAAALCCCCQGQLFLLSGEEFGRSKGGERNSYRSPMSVNRMDWQRAWDNEALAAYYRGLFALRMRMSALCDKKDTAPSRVVRVEEPGERLALIGLDNRGKGKKWPQALVLVNAGEKAAQIALPQGPWQVLCDGEDSFLWRDQQLVFSEQATLEPMSVMILGSV